MTMARRGRARRHVDDERYNFSGSAAVAVLIGAVLAWAARTGALQLLVAIGAMQALLAFAWMQVVRVPGRTGGLVVAALAAVGVDVAASVWPHSRLAAMLVVLALAVPVMFVHQLLRGAARVRVGRVAWRHRAARRRRGEPAGVAAAAPRVPGRSAGR